MTSKTNSFAARSHRHDAVLRFPAMSVAEPESVAPTPQDSRPATAPIVEPAGGPGGRAATMTDTSVGRQIRVIRRSQGRTLKDLSRVIGVTGAQLHRYETGQRESPPAA